MTAYNQFNTLSEHLEEIRENQDQDKWIFMWGNSTYSAKKIYEILMGNQKAPLPMQWIWKTCSLPRHKFFCWLMLNDKINTFELLSRKSFALDSTECVLCKDNLEDRTHLIFYCSLSEGFWWSVGVEWNTDMNIYIMIMEAKQGIIGISSWKF